MKLKGILLVTAALLLPTAALAAPGVVTESVGLRAGPGTGFPLVDRIPGGSHVNIHGCLKGDAWCDVSWSSDRGWVSAEYLEWLYRNHYVYLPDYVDEIGVPVVPFVLGTYWADYYAGRPWYHHREHWAHYWRGHEHVAERPIGGEGRGRHEHAGIGPGPAGHERPGAPSQVAHEHGMHDHDMHDHGMHTGPHGIGGRFASGPNGPDRGHFDHMHGSMGNVAHAPRMNRAPHFATAPHGMPHMAQPNIGHAPAMNAHAQMAAPRAAAPAMPHMGGGGPVGGAPHMAAPGGGGGPGRHH